jgi:hypothetical protein
VYQSPVQAGAGRGLVRNVVAGWSVAPILQYRSWRPFNVITGIDNYGDNYITTHRPWGVGRDAGHGPDFFTTDLRLSRKFALGETKRWNLEVLAEGFNMTNRTNFRTVNQVVGNATAASLPHPIQAVRGNPDQALSYTSALEPRQFQFGIKLNY